MIFRSGLAKYRVSHTRHTKKATRGECRLLKIYKWVNGELFDRFCFFGNQFEEAGDFLLIKSLTHVVAFHLIFIATL